MSTYLNPINIFQSSTNYIIALIKKRVASFVYHHANNNNNIFKKVFSTFTAPIMQKLIFDLNMFIYLYFILIYRIQTIVINKFLLLIYFY